MSEDIRSLRNRKKMTQKELAQLTGVSLRQLSKVERGLETPDVSFLTSVAGVLGLDVAHLKSLYKHHNDSSVVIGEGYVTAVSGETFTNSRRREPEKEKIRIIDLFCGTEGFHQN